MIGLARRSGCSSHSSLAAASSHTDLAGRRPVGSTPASRERRQESAIGGRTSGVPGSSSSPRRRSSTKSSHASRSSRARLDGTVSTSTATQGLSDKGSASMARHAAGGSSRKAPHVTFRRLGGPSEDTYPAFLGLSLPKRDRYERWRDAMPTRSRALHPGRDGSQSPRDRAGPSPHP